MRGEHGEGDNDGQGEGGSSPHARGARYASIAIGNYCGIIPACAGSTAVHGPGSISIGDHPRMRGEHLLARAPVYI